MRTAVVNQVQSTVVHSGVLAPGFMNKYQAEEKCHCTAKSIDGVWL